MKQAKSISILTNNIKEQANWKEALMHYTIQMDIKDRYSFVKELGHGAQGEVYLARERNQNQQKNTVAIKTISK